jgi:hypothetical protein
MLIKKNKTGLANRPTAQTHILRKSRFKIANRYLFVIFLMALLKCEMLLINLLCDTTHLWIASCRERFK